MGLESIALAMSFVSSTEGMLANGEYDTLHQPRAERHPYGMPDAYTDILRYRIAEGSWLRRKGVDCDLSVTHPLLLILPLP